MEDIRTEKEMSIEQGRLKMEWDKLVEAGEEKRRETRRKIAELRLRFKRLKEQNEKLPEHMRVTVKVCNSHICPYTKFTSYKTQLCIFENVMHLNREIFPQTAPF